MRQRARVDRNHGEIVEALRSAGCTVQSIAAVGRGCPDLLVGFRHQNFLFEIKDGSVRPSKRRLTGPEAEWHIWWSGQVSVIESVEQALEAIGLCPSISRS